MKLVVRETADLAAAAAADEMAAAIRGAIGERGQAAIAVSGGTTPVRMFEELAKTDLAWSAVDVFQVDERIAPEGHADRNLTVLRDHLLAHVELPSSRFHPMPVGMASLDEAAARYRESLAAAAGDPPVLDVVHLGLGADGHTASLFPGAGTLEREDDVVATGRFAGWHRLSLGRVALDRARRRVWLVTGAVKAPALRSLVEGGDGPAARIATRDSTVFADQDAADLLEG